MAYVIDKLPLPFSGEERWGAGIAASEIKVVDDERRILRFAGSTEALDRDLDVMRVNGWDLKAYRKNPVFLWGHQYGMPPIGRSLSVNKIMEDAKGFKGGKALMFDVMFPDEEISSFADTIYRLYKGKIMHATSVGFIPKKVALGPAVVSQLDEDDPRRAGAVTEGVPPETRRVFQKQELLELSAVTVPSNPEALQEAYAKGIASAEELGKIIEVANHMHEWRPKEFPFRFRNEPLGGTINGLKLSPDEGEEIPVVVPMLSEEEILENNANASFVVKDRRRLSKLTPEPEDEFVSTEGEGVNNLVLLDKAVVGADSTSLVSEDGKRAAEVTDAIIKEVEDVIAFRTSDPLDKIMKTLGV